MDLSQESKLPASSGSLKETPKRTISFKFVYGEHTPESAKKQLEIIKDCNIVAFEQVGGNAEERDRVERELNTLSHADPKSEITREIVESFEEEDVKVFAAGLAGSGKDIVLIDMPDEHPKIELVDQFENAEREYVDSLKDCRNFGDTLSKLRSYFAISQKLNTIREQLITQQLKSMQDRFPDKSELSIGVVLGSSHTQPYHELKKAGFLATREFSDGIRARGEKGIGQRMWDWNNAVARLARFFPEKPLTDELLKRVIASDWFHSQQVSLAELKTVEKLIGEASDSEINQLISDMFEV